MPTRITPAALAAAEASAAAANARRRPTQQTNRSSTSTRRSTTVQRGGGMHRRSSHGALARSILHTPLAEDSLAKQADGSYALEERDRTYKLWLMLEEPHSSTPARVLNTFLLTLICISCITICLATLDTFDHSYAFAVIELVVAPIFTVELLTRVFVGGRTLGVRHTLQDPLLYVDLLSLLPFYIDLILVVSECPEHLTQFTVRSSCTSGADVLGIFRLLRLVRMLKLIRYYAEGSTVLITALSRSLEPLLVPTLFFLLIVFVFGSVMYLLEGLLYENPDFDNIFKAAWFMIVTLSTVGYGDAVPNQPIARVVASVAIICGVLVLAMPISIVGNNFSRVWEERDALLLVARLRTNLRERKLTRQDMRFVFNEFQLDEDDGLIGPGEFRLGLRVLGIQLSAESVGKVFKVFDTDESGSLDFGEFVTQLFPGQTDADTLRDEYEAGVGGKSNPLDEQLRATFRDTFREKRSTRDGGHGDSPPDDASPRTAAAEPTAAQAAAAAAKALSLDQQLDIGRHSPTEHPDTIIEGAMAPAAGGGAPTEHGNAQIKEPPNEVLSPPAPPLSRLHQSSRVFCRSLHAFGSAKRVQAHHGSTRCCTTNPSAKPGAKHPCGHGEMTIGIAKRERELAALIAKVKGSPASPSGGHLAGAMSQHHHSLTAEGGADGGRLEHALAAIEQRLAALEERGTGESCAKSLVAIEARLAGMEVATHPHVSTPAAASSRAPSHWARGVLPSTSRTWQAAGPQRGQLESIEATLRTLADQQHRLLAMGNAGGAGGGGAAGGGGIVADSGAGGGIRRASSGLRRDSAPAHRVPPQLGS